MKVCTRCGDYKEIVTQFGIDKRRENQPRPSCYDCERERNAKWRREHHAAYLASKRKYRLAHRDEINAELRKP